MFKKIALGIILENNLWIQNCNMLKIMKNKVIFQDFLHCGLNKSEKEKNKGTLENNGSSY